MKIACHGNLFYGRNEIELKPYIVTFKSRERGKKNKID